MKKATLDATDENILQLIKEQNITSRNSEIKDFVEALDTIEGNMFISLDARWGEGKTFYVRQIEKTLEYLTMKKFGTDDIQDELNKMKPYFVGTALEEVALKNSYFPVYYNAWLYDDHTDPLLSLLYVVVKKCGKIINPQLTKEKSDRIKQMLQSIQVNFPFFSINGEQVVNAVYKDALTVLNNWRASHAYPLHVVTTTLKHQNPNVIVVQRLKRLDSILGKIERFPTMNLYKMQDIGGCRVILDSIDDVYEAIATYKYSRVRHKLIKEFDYIKNPKMSGYRSYHMVYQFHSDKKETYNKNMFIEIQLRTKLQHIWATAVEMMGIYTHSNLKSSQGDEDILRFFTVVSSIFAIQENQPVCPGTSDWLDELLDEMHELDKKHNILKMLEAMKNAAHIIKPKFKNTNGYFLLVLNLEDHNLTITMYKPSEIQIATQVYDTIEARNDPNINAVLVSANSFATVKKAYPNYFVDITDFLNKIKKLYKELETIRQNHKTG